MPQQLYQWTMQSKYSKWNPLGTTHKRHELIPRSRGTYNIRATNHHHVSTCETCQIIQWMQWYPHPQMRTRRPLPMSDPGQFQTTQAAARNIIQDLIWRINLRHGNHPGMLQDKTWYSILRDTKNGSGNAANKSRIDIIWGFYVKVERTILYVQMLLTNWSKIWRKKIQHGIRPRLFMTDQWQGVFLWEKIVMLVIAKIDIWDRKRLIKYSLTYY